MDTVFLLLLGISMLCIPIFIILAIINLILRRPAKKRFVFAGISALVFVISIIGFAFTAEDPAPKTPVGAPNEAFITTMEEPSLTDDTDANADQPASEPVKTSEDTRSSSETSVSDKAESMAKENEPLQQEEEQIPPQKQTAQEDTENQFTEEDTQLYSGDGQTTTDVPQNQAFNHSNNFDTYDNAEQQQITDSYVLNTNTQKFHYPSCESVKKIAPQNYATSNNTRDELIAQGYQPCGICSP